MNNLHCKDLVDQVRTTLDETGITSGKWSDTEIVRAINNAKNHLVNVINTIDKSITGKSASITYVSGTELYDLPKDLDVITRVEITSTKEKAEKIDMDEKEINRATNDVIDSRPCYYEWGSQIGLVNITGNVTVYYLRRIPDLHYGTAAAATVTSLTFSATPNGSTSGDRTVRHITDYYVGAYLDIYSGTGSPQKLLITANTAAGVASFATATLPDTTSLYALAYDLPNEIDFCVILEAAMFLCPKDRTKDIGSIQSLLTTQIKTMTDGLHRSKERKYVEYIGS